MNELVSCYGQVTRTGPLVITCEHAGRRLPSWLVETESERALLATHFGYDLGAAEVARELIRETGSVGIFAEYSRLVCDPNRAWDDPGCIASEIEGNVLAFNQHVTVSQRTRRKNELYDTFHQLVDTTLRQRSRLKTPFLLLSVHSFAPVLGDDVRTMEIGVLFDQYVPLAYEFSRHLGDVGFITALNQPYSGTGINGRIYSAARHGTRHHVPYLEVEMRQDLLDPPAQARAIAHRLLTALRQLELPDR